MVWLPCTRQCLRIFSGASQTYLVLKPGAIVHEQCLEQCFHDGVRRRRPTRTCLSPTRPRRAARAHTHTHTLTRRTAPHRDRPCNAIHRGHRPRQRQRRPRAISWRRATLPPSRPHGVLLSYLTVFEADESATHACSSYWSTKLTFVIRIIFINIMTYWIN